jgi:hypothetical protein
MTEEETEIAVMKHTRRRKAFEEQGLSANDAWNLADKLWERDEDIGDDRRLCFECKNYVDHKCIKMPDRFGKPQTPSRFILQRCPMFKMKGKS